MKRTAAMLIISLFLLPTFTGMQWLYENNEKTKASIKEITMKTGRPIDESLTRGTVNETDALGGSWFDDFEDEDGIQGSNNISVQNGEVKIDSSVVGIWHIDEGGGSTTNDSSGNGNDGTLQAMEENDWVNGKIGKGLQFGGGGEYVTVDNEENFDFEHNDSFSIETWIKTSKNNDNYIIGRRDGAGTIWRGYCICIFTNGNIEVHLIHHHLNNEKIWVKGGTNVADGQWHHIGFSYNGSGVASGVKIYVDGNLETPSVSNDNLGGKTILNNIPLKIGARGDGQGQSSFVGTIDETYFFNRVITSSEFSEHYNGTYNNLYLFS